MRFTQYKLMIESEELPKDFLAQTPHLGVSDYEVIKDVRKNQRNLKFYEIKESERQVLSKQG